MQEIRNEIRQLKEFYKTSTVKERKIIKIRLTNLEEKLKRWNEFLAK